MPACLFDVYCIYILYSSSAYLFYVGYSEDPWRRIKQHNNNQSFKFTGRTNDWVLKAVFNAGKSRAEAIRFAGTCIWPRA
jgi:putative endonuclease